MKYVLDASVAVKCVLPERDSPRAVPNTRRLLMWRATGEEIIIAGADDGSAADAVGLLMCQQAIIEERTRNLTLVNTYRRLVLDSFPSAPQRLTVHALLTDGLGPITLTLLAYRLDTLDEIYDQSGRVIFTDPLPERFLLIRTSRLSFPVPGRYEFRLLAEGESIAQCVLEVMQRRDQHG